MLVEAGVVGEFGVEGTHEDPAGLGDYALVLVLSEDLHPRAGSGDRGGADKHGGHGFAEAGDSKIDLAAGSLAAKGVAAGVDVDETEGGLITRGAVGQAGGLACKDGTCAGAIDAHAIGHGGLNGLGEAPAISEFADGGGLSPRDDQPLKAGEVFGLANLDAGDPEALEGAEVFGDGPLEGKDTNGGLGESGHVSSLAVRVRGREASPGVWVVGGRRATRLGGPAA